MLISLHCEIFCQPTIRDNDCRCLMSQKPFKFTDSLKISKGRIRKPTEVIIISVEAEILGEANS